jgi:amino acid adenylation domain-containing protein
MSPENPTLAGLAPEERRALLERLLRAEAQAAASQQPVTQYPMSYGQRALWYIHQLAPDSSAYNIGTATHAPHPINLHALQRALQSLVNRHEALRTTFANDEAGPVQRVHSHMEAHLEVVDAHGWDDKRLDEEATALFRRPYDLEQGPMFRVCLFSRADDDHLLIVGFFHAIADGWSIGLFLLELSRLYAAESQQRPTPETAARPQYADYAAWQTEMLQSAEGERLRAFWVDRFGGELPQIELPLDRPRPALQSFHGASVAFGVDGAMLKELYALAGVEQVTLYTLLLAAYQTLLHRYTGQDDIIIGTPLACRAQSAFQHTIGFFANGMPLRSTLPNGCTFRSLLQQTRTTALEALAHQEYPFALLVEQIKPARIPNRAPVFEVAFNYMRTQSFSSFATLDEASSASDNSLPQLRLIPRQIAQEAGQFDLAMDIGEHDGALHCAINYSTDLFDTVTVERMAGHYTQLLRAILENPDALVAALPMLTEAEEASIAGWNATSATYPQTCLHERVSAQATATPNATALRCGDQSLTYSALEARTTRLAHHLRTLGVEPGALVGVFMDRSIDMVVALLGVLKAGGAYVPLDPGFPAARIALMLEESGAPLIVTQQALAGDLPPSAARQLCLDGDWAQAAEDTDAPLPQVDPESLAYVIFTSGSTGRPKGVEIPHRAVVNFLESMRVAPGLSSRDVLAAVTTLSFDIAVLELFLPLVTGAECVILPRQTAANGHLLAAALTAVNATVMQATPATWRMLLAAGWRAPTGFRALCGGEALPPTLAQALLDAGCTLWNMYGPTETTIWSAIQQIEDATPPIVIGRPIANTQLHILNDAMQPCPVGVQGELWIGGDGLAHGYRNLPDLTADRFVPDPFRAGSAAPHARLYRTGDLARRLPNGAVEVLGRTDHQVKIRGYRIELGEIEAALASHAAVREAVVVARDDGRGAQRLVAYLVANGDAPAAGALRLHLRASLPDYMIPAAFLVLEALPQTPNGKIDRRALPAPETVLVRRDEPKALPTTPTERAVAAVWSDALGESPKSVEVGLYDNFFDLGGHSLLAMDVLSRLERMLGPKLNPALLRAQTLGQVAASYDEMLGAQWEPATESHTPAPEPQPALEPQPAPESGLRGRLLGAVKRAVNPGATS